MTAVIVVAAGERDPPTQPFGRITKARFNHERFPMQQLELQGPPFRIARTR